MGKKILIADDEPHIRALLEEVLEDFSDMGVDIIITKDGVSALSTAIEEQPDLIFLDIMMPGMNGYEVCTKLRQESHIKKAYIIMLTAKGQDVDKERGKVAGADRYLTKPFDPDEITDLTYKILGLEKDASDL